jgi:hypothetical protein
VQNEQQRPTTPSRREKSRSSADNHSPCSQPLHSLNTRPKTSITQVSTPRSPTSSKRGLSRRTIANITPNHNPNFQPHSPGKTPEAVPVNPSPNAKRSRRSHKKLPSPVSTGALLKSSSECERPNIPRMHDDCPSRPLEFGDLPADIDMHGSSPSPAAGMYSNRSAELTNVPGHSPLTGSHDQMASAAEAASQQRSPAIAAHAARSSRLTPPTIRGSVSLMRVPECSEEDGEPDAAADTVQSSREGANRNSLRNSLLKIDPMRVSYGNDGIISLAGGFLLSEHAASDSCPFLPLFRNHATTRHPEKQRLVYSRCSEIEANCDEVKYSTCALEYSCTAAMNIVQCISDSFVVRICICSCEYGAGEDDGLPFEFQTDIQAITAALGVQPLGDRPCTAPGRVTGYVSAEKYDESIFAVLFGPQG